MKYYQIVYGIPLYKVEYDKFKGCYSGRR